ncbi:MAG TPA: hypothetical protein VGE02_06005 [Gemmatimonadales bacterium]
MSHPTSSSTHLPDAPAPAPLTFAQWAAGTLRRWRLIGGTALGVSALFVAAALVLPPVYRAEASFVSKSSDGVKLPSGLAGMAGLAGVASSMGMNIGGEPSESPAFYVQLMQSRELLTRLLESEFADPREDAPGDSARLVEIMDLGRKNSAARRMELGIERLRRDIGFMADPRTNLVKIEVEMPHAALSAAVANRVTDLVERFNREQRTTMARDTRVFVEERLREAEAALRAAENRHRDFLLQNRQWRSSPTLVSEEQRLDRRVQSANALMLTLQREYESARIEEVNDAPVVTLVDAAIAPTRPRWPRPAPLAVLAVAAGLVVGLLTAGSATVMADWALRNPRDAEALRRALPGGRRRRARSGAVAGVPVATPGAAAQVEESPPVRRAADPSAVV